MDQRACGGLQYGRGKIGPKHKRLNWPSDVLESERAKLFERESEPVLHMVPNWSRNANATGRAFGLDSSRDIHRFTVQISPVGNRVANIDSNAEADGSIGRLITVMYRNPLLYLHGTAHGPINAVEHNQERIAPSLDDPTAMLVDRGVYQVPTQRPKTCESSCVIRPDEAAVAHHIGVHDGDQFSPIRRFSS
jgi:hypothetical protein